MQHSVGVSLRDKGKICFLNFDGVIPNAPTLTLKAIESLKWRPLTVDQTGESAPIVLHTKPTAVSKAWQRKNSHVAPQRQDIFYRKAAV